MKNIAPQSKTAQRKAVKKAKVIAANNPSSSVDEPWTEHRIDNFYRNKINSCRARKIEFLLSRQDVIELLKVEHCAYTGVKLTRTGSNNIRRPTDLTLERVDCEKGYTVDNTISVCYAANNIKAFFETEFRKDSVQVLHKISASLKKLEEGAVKKDLSVVQRFVRWMADRVGV